MREFVTDVRLHRALDEVESWLGYDLPAVSMPDEHRQFAHCAMGLSKDRFELWYIEEEPQSQATYCHELAHAIQWIDGDPTVCAIHSIPILLAPSKPVEVVGTLVQHISVWSLVKEMGFDESEAGSPHVKGLTQLICENQLYSDSPPDRITRFQAVTLAWGLSYPATHELRDNLRRAAKDMIPDALELAETITSGFEKHPRLSPQEYQNALTALLNLIGTPTETLQVSFLSKTCPNFRTRILAAVGCTTHSRK